MPEDFPPVSTVIGKQSGEVSENTSLFGFDASSRIKGPKRHIITDTCGHLIVTRLLATD